MTEHTPNPRLTAAASGGMKFTKHTFGHTPDLLAEVTRLREENAQALKALDGLTRLGELVTGFRDPSGVLDVTGLKNRIVALERVNAGLVEALKPFAHGYWTHQGRETEVWCGMHTAENGIWDLRPLCRVGDLHAARQALGARP